MDKFLAVDHALVQIFTAGMLLFIVYHAWALESKGGMTNDQKADIQFWLIVTIAVRVVLGG